MLIFFIVETRHYTFKRSDGQLNNHGINTYGSANMWVKLAQNETPNIVLMNFKAANWRFIVECVEDSFTESQKIIFRVTDENTGQIYDDTAVVSS